MKQDVEKLQNVLPLVRTIRYPAMSGMVVPVALAWAVVLVAFAAGLPRTIAAWQASLSRTGVRATE